MKNFLYTSVCLLTENREYLWFSLFLCSLITGINHSSQGVKPNFILIGITIFSLTRAAYLSQKKHEAAQAMS